MNTPSELFSRETVAGYDRDRLERAVVALVGCGAAGNNIAQCLALTGVGELRLVDPDHVELSNVTRSPLLRADRLRSERLRYKAHECARAILDLSYASAPVVRSAVARIEELGLGALVGCDVVIAAVDSLTVRARLADMTRRLSIPMVELGFSAPRGQVSVFPNRADDEPCWRCLHPHVMYGSASCALYARRVVAEGRIPATQTLAATFGALATEAAIQALHGEFPLGGLLTFNIRRGISRRLELTTDPECPGVHRRWTEITPVPVRSTAPASALFDALRDELSDPILYLPEPFLREAPCYACGIMAPVGKPEYLVTEPPSCEGCRTEPGIPSESTERDAPVYIHQIAQGDDLARWKMQRFGLRPGAIVEVSDRASTKILHVALAGGPDDLYITRRRTAPSTDASSAEGFTPAESADEDTSDDSFVASVETDDGFAALT